MVDISKSVKKALGLEPMTRKEAKEAFNKQKKKDTFGWSNKCDEDVKTIRRCIEIIEDKHKSLINNRYEMEAALGRNFDGLSVVIPKDEIAYEVNTKFLELKKLKEAIKVTSAKNKEEAEQRLLVAQ